MVCALQTTHFNTFMALAQSGILSPEDGYVLVKLMDSSRSSQMVSRLRDMQATAPDIIASAVVTVDGLTLASVLPSELDEDRISAMSAAMLSLGERIASELQRGALDEVYIRGEEGFVLLTAVGQDAVLTALSRNEGRLGLIFLEMRRAAEDLQAHVA